VATVGNAAPMLTILWGTWLLGERVTPTLLAGGVLVLGGILWTTRPPLRRDRAAAALEPAPCTSHREPCADAA
jgi:drug/metabolite transporter (DMT)-like permease